jgi:hypothetical protein
MRTEQAPLDWSPKEVAALFGAPSSTEEDDPDEIWRAYRGDVLLWFAVTPANSEVSIGLHHNKDGAVIFDGSSVRCDRIERVHSEHRGEGLALWRDGRKLMNVWVRPRIRVELRGVWT